MYHDISYYIEFDPMAQNRLNPSPVPSSAFKWMPLQALSSLAAARRAELEHRSEHLAFRERWLGQWVRALGPTSIEHECHIASPGMLLDPPGRHHEGTIGQQQEDEVLG